MITNRTIKTALLFCSLLWLFCLSPAFAAPEQFAGQDGTTQVEYGTTPAPGSDIEMADELRRDGKIYVVVGVFLAIMAGTIFYLVRIDRKVARLEREMADSIR